MEQPESPAHTQDLEQPTTVHITPNPHTATQRTRNRIKEHGPHFTHTKQQQTKPHTPHGTPQTPLAGLATHKQNTHHPTTTKPR
jgi:hypothetical protein